MCHWYILCRSQITAKLCINLTKSLKPNVNRLSHTRKKAKHNNRSDGATWKKHVLLFIFLHTLTRATREKKIRFYLAWIDFPLRFSLEKYLFWVVMCGFRSEYTRWSIWAREKKPERRKKVTRAKKSKFSEKKKGEIHVMWKLDIGNETKKRKQQINSDA